MDIDEKLSLNSCQEWRAWLAEHHTDKNVYEQRSPALINTPTVCRKLAIHPRILDAYRSGRLFTVLGTALEKPLELNESGLAVEEGL